MLLFFSCFASVLLAQEVKDSLNNTVIPFVEIYSDQGDLIGQTDCIGKINKSLLQKISDAKTSTLSFVHPSYYTKELKLDSVQKKNIVELSPIMFSLPEVNVFPNKDDFKYLCITAYFRSLQINNNRPHYYMDGFVEYYINIKTGKIKLNVLCNKSFVNQKIKQIKETKVSTFYFIMNGIPDFENVVEYKTLQKEYTLKENKDSLIEILDKKENNSVGFVSSYKDNVTMNLSIYSQNNPRVMGAFGIENILYNFKISAIYREKEKTACSLENLNYYKESRSYNLKKKEDKEYQQVDATHEVFVLGRKYTNKAKENIDFYQFKNSENTEICKQQVDNIYYQELPRSVMEYIKDNLTRE